MVSWLPASNRIEQETLRPGTEPLIPKIKNRELTSLSIDLFPGFLLQSSSPLRCYPQIPLHMKFLLSFAARPNRRSILRDLHAFGIMNVFRRPSIFRVWEPLRETPRSGDEEFVS
jgi:hypothetical protein